MKLRFIAPLVISLLSITATPAFAHAQVTSSSPLKNQVITKLPEWIWIEFDGDLMTFGDKNPNEIIVTDSKSKRVDTKLALVGGARISTKLKPGIKAGRYLVSYRVVSEDGHPVQGSFYFTYRK